MDYGRFLDQLQQRVSPVLEDYRQSGYEGVNASYTGVTSVVFEVQRSLLSDLFRSFLTALLLVGLVMIVTQRSLRAGLVAMVPNVFPMVLLFGGMGWLDLHVDIGTVMTASVALGIAVDGTFHFLKWFRRELEAGKSLLAAAGYSFRHCGRALTQATIVCSAGLLVYSGSGFLPARHFAWMLLLLLIAALVGDLIVLPSLLVGPLGRFFCRRRTGDAGASPQRAPQPAPADSEATPSCVEQAASEPFRGVPEEM